MVGAKAHGGQNGVTSGPIKTGRAGSGAWQVCWALVCVVLLPVGLN